MNVRRGRGGRGRFHADSKGEDVSAPNAGWRAPSAGTLVEGSRAGHALGTTWDSTQAGWHPAAVA